MPTDMGTPPHTEPLRATSMSAAEAARIQQQLDRILASESFIKSPQLSRFLRFCIERVVLGRQDELKEQVLGVEVFRRSSSFDPRVDPIVRVEARRLRSKLEEYYAGEGRFDPLVIYYQRGDYVPRFASVSAPADKEAAPALSGRILIVEDERLVARDLENRLKSLGYSVTGSAASGDAALELAERSRPDLVLMDIALSGPMRGTEAARQIWQRWQIPVVYLTAFSDAVVLEDIRGAETYGYVLKPFEPRLLHGVLQLALGRRGKEQTEAAPLREQARMVALLSALEDSRVQLWEWRVRDASLAWPDAVERSPERLLPEAEGDPREFLERIIPADRERVRKAFTRAIGAGSRVEVGYRRNTESGEVVCAISSGAGVRDEAGTLILTGLEFVLPAACLDSTAAEQIQKSSLKMSGLLKRLSERNAEVDPVTASALNDISQEIEKISAIAAHLSNLNLR